MLVCQREVHNVFPLYIPTSFALKKFKHYLELLSFIIFLDCRRSAYTIFKKRKHLIPLTYSRGDDMVRRISSSEKGKRLKTLGSKANREKGDRSLAIRRKANTANLTPNQVDVLDFKQRRVKAAKR